MIQDHGIPDVLGFFDRNAEELGSLIRSELLEGVEFAEDGKAVQLGLKPWTGPYLVMMRKSLVHRDPVSQAVLLIRAATLRLALAASATLSKP